MRRNITLAAGVVVLLIGTLMMAGIAEAEPFKRSLSGWSVATEIDTNGDGVRAESITVAGRGTFGLSRGNAQVEFAPGFTLSCDGNPGNLEFEYAAFTFIQIFKKGDGLAWGLDHGTLCYNPVFGTSTVEVHIFILGGTGRFEGATGSAILSGQGIVLASEPDRGTHAAVGGTIEGEIFLAP